MRRLAMYCLLIVLSSQTSFATASIDLLRYQLRNLRDGTVQSLSEYRGTPILLMVFEPECPWCVRQTAVLNEMQRNCEGIRIFGVGVHGDRSQLWREVHKLRPNFSVFEASPDFLVDVGDIPGTPLLLLSDAAGNYVWHKRGYRRADELCANSR